MFWSVAGEDFAFSNVCSDKPSLLLDDDVVSDAAAAADTDLIGCSVVVVAVGIRKT